MQEAVWFSQTQHRAKQFCVEIHVSNIQNPKKHIVLVALEWILKIAYYNPYITG